MKNNFPELAEHYPKINRYLNQLVEERADYLATIRPDSFLEQYACIQMIEEKIQILYFGLTYPELFDPPFQETLIEYCDKEYLSVFYDQRERDLLNQQQSLFYTIWPEIPERLIWETPWKKVARKSPVPLPLLKDYYESLQRQGRDLLEQASPATIQLLIPQLLAVDAKCNLLFWFLDYSISENPEKESDILRIVEREYKQAHEELLSSKQTEIELDFWCNQIG